MNRITVLLLLALLHLSIRAQGWPADYERGAKESSMFDECMFYNMFTDFSSPFAINSQKRFFIFAPSYILCDGKYYF